MTTDAAAPMPIKRLMVANRSEIAIRVFRTAHELAGACAASLGSDLSGGSSGQEAKWSILRGTLVLEGRTLLW